MIWLVEEYDDYVKDLVVEIEKQGHTCDFINYYKMQEDNTFTGTGLPRLCGKWKDDDCVLFYGSIQTAQWLIKNRPWIPGVWYTFDNYKCSNYYSYIGEFLLNQDYTILPRAEVKRRIIELYEKYGVDGCIFVRPDNGTKSFGGRTFEWERFDKDWSLIVEPTTDVNSLVVVSSPKVIKREYRFVIAEGECLTGSQYKDAGSAEIIAGFDNRAVALAEEIASVIEKAGFMRDPMYTIDVCEDSDGDHHLMEINCFCCAGLYAADLAAVVSCASILADREHNSYHVE